MYSKFYGFLQKPFELNPDPNVIFLSETHQEVLSVLRYGVLNRKRFLLITGDVGTGKSTVVQGLIHSLDSNLHLCYIPHPNFSIQEFYYFLSVKFGLEEFDGNKAKFILSFGKFLQECKTKNDHVLLIIDEVQVLSREVLEEIRLISNQELYDTSDALSIFLVGQPEFNNLLANKKFFPLQNRIAINITIAPLSFPETSEYVKFRLHKAGCDAVLFTQKALQEIYRITRGIPRSINILCDNALLAGFAGQSLIIDETIISQCAKELCYEDREITVNEEKSSKPDIKEKASNKEQSHWDKKKIKKFIQVRKISLIFVMLFILFMLFTSTTEYWGRIPGAIPLRVWFEKSRAHDLILQPLKYVQMVWEHGTKLSATGKSIIDGNADNILKGQENKNSTTKNTVANLDGNNSIEEMSIDKKNKVLVFNHSMFWSEKTENGKRSALIFHNWD